MNIVQKLNYLNTTYNILRVEQEFIVHPAAFGFIPLSTASLQCSFSANFQIKDYRLLLDDLIVGNHDSLNLGGTRIEGYAQRYPFNALPVTYTGVMLVGSNLVKEYPNKGNTPAYYSYEKVYELVFEEGALITTIDQSKAMHRIRKNLELGLRSLSKSRDVRCITRFMNAGFIGDYKRLKFNYLRINYIKEMKKEYPLPDFIKSKKA